MKRNFTKNINYGDIGFISYLISVTVMKFFCENLKVKKTLQISYQMGACTLLKIVIALQRGNILWVDVPF